MSTGCYGCCRAELAASQERVKKLEAALAAVEITETATSASGHRCYRCDRRSDFGVRIDHAPDCPFAVLASDTAEVAG